MPEMTDAMYCHQQICIPPTYPYLLRQYAKAAIRSQPNDLLRWSCAYFRALALGLRPPVKLRLEYPIPHSHYGLTPGWLKTLLHQLAGSRSVTWPQLYDRWRGACLQVEGLQEIILLAGFPDPVDIPWLKFVATAAGHLTQNLTNTMILICELLTEEPEGGSAMIPYITFAELYHFLANIDASEPRLVRNFYFTESNLDLTKRETAEISDKKSEVSAKSIIYSEKEAMTAEESRFSDLEKYLKTIQDTGEEEDFKSPKKAADQEKKTEDEEQPVLETHSSCYVILDPEDGKLCKEKHEKSESSEESTESSEVLLETKYPSKESMEGEDQSVVYTVEDVASKGSEESSSATTSEVSLPGYVEVELPAVAGIGPQVPEEMVEAVLKYMRECANKQQGMVMPRNIKHFLCPPLELCLD